MENVRLGQRGCMLISIIFGVCFRPEVVVHRLVFIVNASRIGDCRWRAVPFGERHNILSSLLKVWETVLILRFDITHVAEKSFATDAEFGTKFV